jgi:hypothetical protein
MNAPYEAPAQHKRALKIEAAIVIALCLFWLIANHVAKPSLDVQIVGAVVNGVIGGWIWLRQRRRKDLEQLQRAATGSAE